MYIEILNVRVFDPEVLFLGVLSTDILIDVHEDVRTKIILAASFVTFEQWSHKMNQDMRES